MIDISNCRVVIAVQPRKQRADPSCLEVLYSDENIRILKIFDIAANPEKGCDIVRVDIFS